MNKKRVPPELYKEAVKILLQSDMLKETVNWQSEQVERLKEKYSDEEYEELDWMDKEAHIKECEEILGRLEQSVREMAILDGMYEDLRKKLKEQCGRDLLPPLEGERLTPIDPEDEVSLL